MIHVLVIDDVRAVRDMTIAALRSELDLEVRGHAASPEQIYSQLVWCDLVVINAGAESDASLQLIDSIHKLYSEAKIIVIGLIGTHSFLLRCLEAGINGYLLQDSSLSDLLRTIRAVQGDPGFLSSPRLEAANLASELNTEPAGPTPNRLGLLTRREREVLALMQHGQTNKEIAEALVVELGTVKNHVHSILHKLNLTSRRETLYLPQMQPLWQWPQTAGGPVRATKAPDYTFASAPRFSTVAARLAGD